jgi:hypothetical protein
MWKVAGGLLIVIAVSPFAIFAGAYLIGMAFENPLGGLLGLIMLYGSLGLLVFVPGMVGSAAKIWLGPALATCLLLIPAIIMYQQPEAEPITATTTPNPITLRPNADNPAAVDVWGLSFYYPPTLSRAAPGLPYQYQLDAFVVMTREVHPPPAHFDDTHGDTLDFTTIAPDQVRIQDNRGGYADIHWDGKQFAIVNFHSAGQSVWAIGSERPYHPNHHHEWGASLLGFTPCLAWLLVGLFVIQWRARMSQHFAMPVTAVVLKSIGLAFAACTVYVQSTEPSYGDVPVALPFVLLTMLFYLPGLIIWCWQLFSLSHAMQQPMD